MASLVIGIDPATHSGICIGSVGSKPALLAPTFGADTHEELYGNAVSFFARLLKDCSPDLIAIEAPIAATWGKTNHNTTSITRGLYAIFTGIAHCKGIRVLPVEISTWRKHFLGAGRLPGREAKAQCLVLCKRLGWQAPSHDAAESAGVWHWGCSQIEPQRMQRTEPLFVAGRAPA